MKKGVQIQKGIVHYKSIDFKSLRRRPGRLWNACLVCGDYYINEDALKNYYVIGREQLIDSFPKHRLMLYHLRTVHKLNNEQIIGLLL